MSNVNPFCPIHYIFGKNTKKVKIAICLLIFQPRLPWYLRHNHGLWPPVGGFALPASLTDFPEHLNEKIFEMRLYIFFLYFCSVDKGSVFIVKLPMSAVLVISRISLIYSGFFLKSKAVSKNIFTWLSHRVWITILNVSLSNINFLSSDFFTDKFPNCTILKLVINWPEYAIFANFWPISAPFWLKCVIYQIVEF